MGEGSKTQRRLSISQAWRSAYRLLDKAQRKQIHNWLLISMIGRSIQAFGVISVMPFVALISAPEVVHSHRVINTMFVWSGVADYAAFLILVSACTVGFYLLTAAFTCFEVWYGARLSNELGHNFSTRLFGIYLRQDYVRHLQRNRASALDLVTEGAESTMVGVLVTGIEILSNTLLALMITAMLMLVSIKAALIAALVLAAAYGIIHLIFSRRVERHGEKVYDLAILRKNIVQEALGGIREIKTHHAEENYHQQQATVSQQIAKHSTGYALMEFAPRQLLEATAFSGIVMFALISMLFSPNPGEIMPIIALYGMAAYRLIPTLREIYADMETINHSKFLVTRIEDEFALVTSQRDSDAFDLDLGKDPLVEFENVSFCYPDEKVPAIQGLHLTLRANRCTALIGPSGAGKSTVVDLLTGLLQPSHGEIRVAGVVLNGESIASWQARISYISQSIFLFEGSLAQNIAMQNKIENIDMQRVILACKQAELHTFIASLDKGYDAAVGVGQKLLSGGQLRRLGIARALYRQPDLLILDESLNELDSDIQRSILQTISELEGITVLIVSHDPRVLAYCDERLEITPPSEVEGLRSHHAPL